MRKLFYLLVISSIIFLLVGCTTTKYYTYKINNGDKIKITIKTNNGYDINYNTPFELSKNKEIISYGFFIDSDEFEKYKELGNDNNKFEMIENNSNDDIEYIFYKYNTDSTEYNYVIKIKNSNTGIAIANNISLDSAKDMFEHLNFKKVK